MAVDILEVQRGARYPTMGDWASGRHPASAERSGSPFEFRLVNRGGKMAARELTIALLKYDHCGGAAGSKEQPLSLLVPKAR
jgi:hypothetical protein